MVDGKTGKTIDIVEDRRLTNSIKYFSYYSYKVRSNVKLIVIDMYFPYISLIKKMFPNANIIIDKFHLVNLISTLLNKTRIKIMNYDNISDYMKTSINTLKEYLPYIKNILNNPYHNGCVEGNNNFIKVLKRIAFVFRSFHRFKARIMICKNLLHMKKASAN